MLLSGEVEPNTQNLLQLGQGHSDTGMIFTIALDMCVSTSQVPRSRFTGLGPLIVTETRKRLSADTDASSSTSKT